MEMISFPNCILRFHKNVPSVHREALERCGSPAEREKRRKCLLWHKKLNHEALLLTGGARATGTPVLSVARLPGNLAASEKRMEKQLCKIPTCNISSSNGKSLVFA